MKNPSPMALAKRSTAPVAKKQRGTVNTRPMQLAEVRSRGINTSSYENAEKIDPNKPLTEKQKLFVKNWASGETIRNAALRAGYNDNAGIAYRMVRMPNILKLYEAEKAKYEAVSDMSRKKVTDMLLEAYELAKLTAEPHAMVAAAREVGKICGYYEPVTRKVDITVTGSVQLNQLNQLSDAELLKLVEQGSQIQEQIEQVVDETLREADEDEENDD